MGKRDTDIGCAWNNCTGEDRYWWQPDWYDDDSRTRSIRYRITPEVEEIIRELEEIDDPIESLRVAAKLYSLDSFSMKRIPSRYSPDSGLPAEHKWVYNNDSWENVRLGFTQIMSRPARRKFYEMQMPFSVETDYGLLFVYQYRYDMGEGYGYRTETVVTRGDYYGTE